MKAVRKGSLSFLNQGENEKNKIIERLLGGGWNDQSGSIERIWLGIPDCQNYGNCGDRLCWNAAGLLVQTFHQENQS